MKLVDVVVIAVLIGILILIFYLTRSKRERMAVLVVMEIVPPAPPSRIFIRIIRMITLKKS